MTFEEFCLQNNLSNRQKEVASLVAEGYSNKEVASQLNVQDKTIKFHLTDIYKKFKIKSRLQLAILASEVKTHDLIQGRGNG
jgi:DNA-binding NarL/FixJ family response regulator